MFDVTCTNIVCAISMTLINNIDLILLLIVFSWIFTLAKATHQHNPEINWQLALLSSMMDADEPGSAWLS